MVKLKSVTHLNPLADDGEIFTEEIVNSTPLFLIAPLFTVILVTPFKLGIDWLINKLLLNRSYHSTDPEIRPFKTEKSNPIFKGIFFSQVKLSLDN